MAIYTPELQRANQEALRRHLPFLFKTSPSSAQADLTALWKETKGKLKDAVEEWALGGTEVASLGEKIKDLLTDAHSKAVFIGRQHGGDFSPFEADDTAYAAGIVNGEAEFLARFLADLESGRYVGDDGFLLLDRITGRAELYANKLVGTANESWSLTQGEGVWYWWRTGANESCVDCLELEAASPFREDELPTVPGSCETACVMNCGCRLESSRGQSGFRLPEAWE